MRLTPTDLIDLELCNRPECGHCSRLEAAVERVIRRHVVALFADQQTDARLFQERAAAEMYQ